MSFYLPNLEDRKHYQTNRNDVSGTIYASRNINLDEEAYIKLSHGVASVMTEDDDANLNNIDAMNIGDGTLYVNGAEVFDGGIGYSVLSSHSGDTNTPTPASEDDTIYFNDTQVVSDGTTVKYLSGASTWTTIASTTISGTAPTVLANYEAYNAIMIGHANKVDLIDTSWALVRTLTLPPEFRVSSMVTNGTLAFIGTRHDASGEGRLFLWDGTGTSATESYGIENFELASVKSYGSSVVVGTADGRLLRFNGGGFEELANYPVYMTSESYGDENNDYTTMNHRGMVVAGNQIFAISTSRVNVGVKNYLTQMPGGVWCYDPNVGFYHRHGTSYTRIQAETIATTSVDTSTDKITVSSAPVTGTPVLYNAVSTPFMGGIKELKTYYTIKVDATHVKLAETLTDALAGTAIDLTGTGNNSQILLFYKTFDYGQSYVRSRASISTLGNTMRDERFAGMLAFGADIYDGSLVNKVVLNTPVANIPNRGYFVTPRMFSYTKTDKYGYINVRHAPLKTDDEIVVKYRTTTKANLPVDLTEYTGTLSDLAGTWSDTDTFTTTNDLSSVSEGDEVEIIAGNGSGFTAHISSLSEAGGTWTVNLDEEFIFATASDQFYFVVDNWTKLGTITSSSLESGFRIDKVGEFLQLKVELRGIETKVVDIMIDNQSYRQLI